MMTDNDKSVGEPIDDDDLNNVSGGVCIPELDRSSLKKAEKPAQSSGNKSLGPLNVKPIKEFGQFTVTIGSGDDEYAQNTMNQKLTGNDNDDG